MTTSLTGTAPRTMASPPRTLPDTGVDVSVLVPAKDEAENLPLFMAQAALAFAKSDTR